MEDLTHYLKKHPRMIGVLFTIMLALTQASAAAAEAGAAGASGGYAGM